VVVNPAYLGSSVQDVAVIDRLFNQSLHGPLCPDAPLHGAAPIQQSIAGGKKEQPVASRLTCQQNRRKTFVCCSWMGTSSFARVSARWSIATMASPSSASRIKSAGITVPAGFTGVSISNVSATGGKNWGGNLVSGVIVLGASTGNQGLDPGESVTVTFNATAPSNCATYDWLTAAYQDSLNAGALVTTTPYSLVGNQPQVAVTGCTSACRLGQGYWDNHYPASWPADVMTNGRNLGSVHYTAAELEAILANNAVIGNGLLSLAHQLIAAKLNLANGANGSSIASTIAAADALIGALVVPPSGSDSLAPAATSALTSALDVWNNSCN
jgi:hypothetical protein